VSALQLQLISVDSAIAVSAAALSRDHELPLADGLIYASRLDRKARFIASDTHFQDLPGAVTR